MPLVPNQSYRGPTNTLYAPVGSSGGGGGGGGPNESFSTITMSSLGGLINFTTTLTFNDLATTNGNDFVVNSGIPDTAIVQGFGGAGNASVVAIRAPSSITTNGIQPAISLNMGATDGSAAVIASTNPNTGLKSTLTIVADSVNIPFNLNVSSINGATPGGGGGSLPADILCSSLTINGGTIGLGSKFVANANDPNLFNYAVLDSNTNTIASYSLGTIGGRNQFFTEIGEIDQFWTSTMTGATGQISLNPIGQDSIRLGGLGAAGDITLAPTGGGLINLSATTNIPSIANISSLIVSSINNAQIGGQTMYQVPFITGSGDGSIWTLSVPPSGGVPQQLTSTLITTPSRSYLLSYGLINGQNADVAAKMRLKVYTASASEPQIQILSNANDLSATGQCGGRSMIITGANALRLECVNESGATTGTLNFDQNQSVWIKDLGL